MVEIIQLVEKYQALVHQPTQELFDEVFAKDSHVSLISITKEFSGRESVYQEFLVDLIHGLYSSIDLINDGIHVNKISDELAIVIFRYHTECIRKETNEPYGIEGLETQVVIKEDGKWKILHVHYSK